MIERSESLVEVLRTLPILGPEQWAELTPTLAGPLPEPRELARRLIEKGWLTAYQINQLLQGRGATLLLGPYLLLERIGVGGMGEVFKARHTRLKRVAALKIIQDEQWSDPLKLARFMREAEAAA